MLWNPVPSSGSWRDAVELTGQDQAEAAAATTIHAYPAGREPYVRLRLDGWLHRAAALERRDFPDGRTVFRLGLWPPRQSHGPLRVGWFWGDEAAMVFTALDPHPVEQTVQPGDAVRVSHPLHGDAGVTDAIALPYGPHGPAPVRVRLAGQWHQAHAERRIRFLPDGHEAVRIHVRLLTDGWPMWYPRTYWDSPAITAVPQ